MDKAGSSIIAPATPASAPSAKGGSGGSSSSSASPALAGGASNAAASAAANWKLRIALILLIGVFVFATVYKLNKKKRAAGGSKGAKDAKAGACSGDVCPIPLPGFPGAKAGSASGPSVTGGEKDEDAKK